MILTAATVLPWTRALGQIPPTTFPTTRPTTAPVVLSLEQLGAILNSPQSRADQREEAARRLVARDDAQARRFLSEALVNMGLPAAQIAAAKALADDLQPDRELIFPLFTALSGPGNGAPNLPVSAAAARALTNYRGQPDVYEGLASRIVGPGRIASDSVRREIIRAMASYVEKRTVQTLMTLLRAPDTTPITREAITEALADLTGITELGRDPSRWEQWWQTNGILSEEQLREQMLVRRSARLDQLRTELSDSNQALSNLLRTNYQQAPAAQKQEILLGYLRSPRAEERAVGAILVGDDAQTATAIPPAVRERLREMIADSSARVRIRVAQALAEMNDAESLDLLLAQLDNESDAQVRSALAAAIAPIRSIRAVPSLLKLLNDTYLPASIQAAQALSLLGQTIREQDPALARQTAIALRDKLLATPANSGHPDLREALVDAMVPLRQEPILGDLLIQILREQSEEAVEMRRKAIRAIGEFQLPQMSQTIINVFSDKDERVRLEAVTALGKLPASPDHIPPLRALLGSPETDRSVQEKAWVVLQSILPHLTKEVLSDQADKFKSDPARQIVVLKVLEQQLERNRELDSLASIRLNIGTILLNELQATDPRAPQEAAEYLRKALEYMKTQPNAAELTILNLMQDLMRALLRSGQYTEAVTFASESIRNNSTYLPLMGSSLRAEAEELQRSGKADEALKLIEAIKLMNPKLGEQYERPLADVERWAIERRNLRGVMPTDQLPRSLDVSLPATRPQGSANIRD